MIKIRQNPNFTNWFQVFSFDKLVDEFTKEIEALELAEEIAKKDNQKYIVIENELVELEK
jgi:hypothetical protein